MNPKTLIFLLFIMAVVIQVILFWNITSLYGTLFIRIPTALVVGMFFGIWAGKQK